MADHLRCMVGCTILENYVFMEHPSKHELGKVTCRSFKAFLSSS